MERIKYRRKGRAGTFILKKVILVRRSTVDLRSCSLSGLLAGKLFCTKKKITVRHNTWHHIHLCPLCVLCGTIQHTQHLLLRGCAVFPECVCACFRGAVSLINTSCFVFLTKRKLAKKRKGEVQYRKRGEVMVRCWCSIMRFDYLATVSGLYVSADSTMDGKLTRYMDRSMRRELWSWSRSLTNRSFCGNHNTDFNITKHIADTPHCLNIKAVYKT